MNRGTKYPERVMNNSKVCYSLMFSGNAAGELLPPLLSTNQFNSMINGLKTVPKDLVLIGQDQVGLMR